MAKMNIFAEIAKKETTLSEVMEGRDKKSMDDIMKTFPDGVTVTEFDFITMHDPKKGESTFPVMAIAEDDNICFFGGAIMVNICKGWADAFGGDVAKASESLKQAGGVKMKFSAGKTRSGNNITNVEILG